MNIYKAKKTVEINKEKRTALQQELKDLRKPWMTNHPISINDHYYNEKVKDKTILVKPLGMNVRGNMQYVLNELNSNPVFEGYKIYVRANKDTAETVQGYIDQNNWVRTEVAHTGYGKKMESCKYLITESYFPYEWVKKDGQILIDTWHGTPLKKLGLLKNGHKCHLQDIQQKNFLNSDYLLYPNQYTKDRMLESYLITPLLSGNTKALMLGYPRTGGMLAVTKERTEEIRKTLAPNNEHIYAYMPTFRGYLDDEQMVAQEHTFLSAMDKGLRDDQVLYVNLHHKVGDSLDYSSYKHIKKFPALIDSYELLTATEALVSDYSSVFFDYLALGKQIVLHLADYETYANFQGLYVDPRELPFDCAYSAQDVLDAFDKGKSYDDSEVMKYFGGYDCPDAGAKLAQLFAGDESGLVLEDYEKDDRKRVMIYSNSGRPGRATRMLELAMTMYDRNKADVYISVDSVKTSEPASKKSAYPMIRDNQCLATTYVPNFASLSRTAMDLHEAGKYTFEQLMDVLFFDYVLVPKRMYGDVKFDTVMIYDAVEPDLVVAFSLAKATNKLLFLQKDMLDQVAAGDTYTGQLISYAAQYCNGVFVLDEDDVARAEGILGDDWAGKVQVTSTPEALAELLNESVADAKKEPIAPLPPMFRHKLLAHGLGGYKGFTYLNTEEAFREAYKNGHRYFEADILMTTDGELVCSHGWNEKSCALTGMEYKEEFQHMTHELFMQQTVQGMPVLDARGLKELMVECPDIFMELDLHSISYEKAKKVTQKLVEIFGDDESLMDRLLVQSNSFGMYEGIRDVYDFKYTQFVVLENIEQLDEIIDFCKNHQISSIAIKQKYASKTNLKKIHDAGLAILVFSVDEIARAKQCYLLGANTICTNLLNPADIQEMEEYIIVYNSKKGANEQLSNLISQNILRGDLSKTAKGSYEYKEEGVAIPKDGYPLLKCLFTKFGSTFGGWAVRTRQGKEDWKWLTVEGTWLTTDQIKRSKTQKKIFADGETVYKKQFGNVSKLIFEAVWK